MVFVVWLILSVVVCHGIWVVARAIIRGCVHLGKQPTEASVAAALCPLCGSASDPHKRPHVCRFCGWAASPIHEPNQRRPDLALAQLRRRVERFGSIDLIEAATVERLVAAINAEEARLAPVEPVRSRVDMGASNLPPHRSVPTPPSTPTPTPAPTFRPVAVVAPVAEPVAVKEQVGGGSTGVLPMVAISVLVVVQALAGNPTTGVEPTSIFGRIGPLGSLVPPLLIVTLTLVGWAIRERSARFAFAAGLFAHLTTTTGYLFVQPPTALRLDPALWVRLAQVNAIVASLTSLTWIGALVVGRRRTARVEAGSTISGLLTTLIHLAIVLNASILVAGTVGLWLQPIPTNVYQVIAGPVGWVALLLGVGII